MAKKIMIPSTIGGDIKHNLQEAMSAENNEGAISNEAMPQETKLPQETKQPKQRVEERSADRGPMMNVHVPFNVKRQLEDVKASRREKGIKVTVDTIIYECIIDWLNKNYEKETK